MSDFEFAKTVARKALPEMIMLKIPPTPQNYALWYLYASEKNKQLTVTVNRLKDKNTEFTDALSRQLYDDYVVAELGEQQALRKHTFTAQGLMSDLLEIMGAMNTETSSYNKKLDGYVEKLSGKYQDEGLQNMVKELLEKTSRMRESGSELNNKLTESKKEVEQLRQNLEKITEEANRDALTGAANRKAFDHYIKDFVETSKKNKTPFSLLMVDIDFFKKFNDKFGHLIGDEVLKIVSRELMNAVKGRDIVARYGGEEFAILLPETPLNGAMAVAENLRKSIASRDLARKDTKENYGSMTVSIGVAQFYSQIDTVNSIIQRADEALYRSKKAGRNRVTQENVEVEEES